MIIDVYRYKEAPLEYAVALIDGCIPSSGSTLRPAADAAPAPDAVAAAAPFLGQQILHYEREGGRAGGRF